MASCTTEFRHSKRSRGRKPMPGVGRPEFLTPTNVALTCRKRSAELLGGTTSTFPLVTYADSSIFVSRSGAFTQERVVMRHAGLVLGTPRHVLPSSLESNAARNKIGLGFVARNRTMVVHTAPKPNPSSPARQQLSPNSRLGYVSTWLSLNDSIHDIRIQFSVYIKHTQGCSERYVCNLHHMHKTCYGLRAQSIALPYGTAYTVLCHGQCPYKNETYKLSRYMPTGTSRRRKYRSTQIRPRR